MKWIFYILLMLIPFVIAPWEDWTRLPKEVFYWGCVASMIFIMLARGKVVLRGRNLPLAILFAWLTWQLWSIGFAVLNNAPMIVGDREHDVLIYEQFLNTNILNMLLAAFLFAWIIGERFSVSTALKCMMIPTALLIVLGFLQYFNVPFMARVGHPWRVSGFFGNPNNYNEHIAIALPLFLLMKDRMKWVLIALGVIAISLSKFWIHYSPGAGLLAVPFGFLFLLLVKKPKMAAVLIAVCLVVGAAFYPMAKTAARLSFENRMDFYRITLDEIKAHPERENVGWGLGMYKQRVGKIPGGYRRDGSWAVLCEAHNEYLQFYAEAGRVGAAMLGIIVLHLAWVVFRNRHDYRALVMAACLINAGAVCAISFPMHIACTGVYVFVLYAMIHRIHYGNSTFVLRRP